MKLFTSRKFWIMMVDVIVSLVTYFTAKYASPELGDDVLKLIVTFQPVVLFVIGSITAQNVAGIKATATTQSAQISGAAEVTSARIDSAPTQ